MSILKFFLGDKGEPGTNGINGLGPSDVQTDKLDTPVFNALNNNKLSSVGVINFDRASIASHEDRHHNNVWKRSETTTNFMPFSEDFDQWDDTGSRWTRIGRTTDPFGGNSATEINLDVTTEEPIGLSPVLSDFNSEPLIVGGYVTVSFWFKIISGTISTLDIAVGTTKFDLNPPSNDYQYFTISVPVLSGSFLLSINPRGLIGARFSIYAVQVENNNFATDYIITDGEAKSVNYFDIERESDKGWLIEQEKTNLVLYSGDLSQTNWVKTNVTIDKFTGEDPFGDINQSINLVWGTVPLVSLDGETDALIEDASYTVSFWAFVGAGSLSSLTVSLGGGDSVIMPQVSIVGFVRFNVAVIAGAGTGINITADSPNLTASLNISGVQVETGFLTSYIKTGSLSQTRQPDIVNCDQAFNIPKPSKSWSFIFRYKSVLNNSDKKYIFTNDQTGADEFSCFFTNDILTLKNGSVGFNITAFEAEKIAITFDGTTLKIYNEFTLAIQTSLTPSEFIATLIHVGADSSQGNVLNGHLSHFRWYDVELSLNEIIYLMGA